jgi:hypothetical protein
MSFETGNMEIIDLTEEALFPVAVAISADLVGNTVIYDNGMVGCLTCGYTWDGNAQHECSNLYDCPITKPYKTQVDDLVSFDLSDPEINPNWNKSKADWTKLPKGIWDSVIGFDESGQFCRFGTDHCFQFLADVSETCKVLHSTVQKYRENCNPQRNSDFRSRRGNLLKIYPTMFTEWFGDTDYITAKSGLAQEARKRRRDYEDEMEKDLKKIRLTYEQPSNDSGYFTQ